MATAFFRAVELAGVFPGLAFDGKGLFLSCTESGDGIAVFIEEVLVLGQGEGSVLDLHAPSSAGCHVRPQVQEFLRADGVPGDPVEKPQQPR